MAVNSQQNSETIVFRAGTKHGPSFDLKDGSVDEGNFCLSIIYLNFTTVFSMYSWNQTRLRQLHLISL